MIFALDDPSIKIHCKSSRNKLQDYEFIGVSQVDEAELYRTFRKALATSASYARVNESLGIKTPESPVNFTPYRGMFIVPKLYGYFPFLDCDDHESYDEAVFELELHDIPYKSYTTNPTTGAHWIFCDQQDNFENTLKFIESYPSDHRYEWIAKYKEEFCVRAVPKYGNIPTFCDEHLVSNYTNDFKYWISEFDSYWKSGLIMNYLNIIKTVDII